MPALQLTNGLTYKVAANIKYTYVDNCWSFETLEQLAKFSHKALKSRLPDCKFSKQKSKFGEFLECLSLEDFVILYGHLVYFTAIWYVLW
jgi:hypothetical protein